MRAIEHQLIVAVVVGREPNAQVQGRTLGVAEARSGGGVPCNAQLGIYGVTQ